MTDAEKSGGAALLHLDDLHVGKRFTSASHMLDETQIKAFAREFDPQPFHLDTEAAKTTLFGGLAASGWHTAAVTMRLLVQGGLPLAGGIIGSGGEISWPKPTRPGDTLTVVSEIEEVTPSRSRPDRGSVRVRSETRNEHGEIVQILRSRLVVARRPGSPADTSAADTGTNPSQKG
jgi:acyl dehydratase